MSKPKKTSTPWKVTFANELDPWTFADAECMMNNMTWEKRGIDLFIYPRALYDRKTGKPIPRTKPSLFNWPTEETDKK